MNASLTLRSLMTVGLVMMVAEVANAQTSQEIAEICHSIFFQNYQKSFDDI